MKVKELLELMEELDGDMEVNIAYQPHYPMTTSANHLKVCNGIAYICENSYSGNEYALMHCSMTTKVIPKISQTARINFRA